MNFFIFSNLTQFTTNRIITKTILFLNFFTFNLDSLLSNLLSNFFYKLTFIKNFFLLSDLVWQEGLLIDFLQKKIIDNWIKKFLIFSSYLFNERYLFEKVTRFFLDFFIWPSHKFFNFEINNVAGLLFINIFLFIFIFILFILLYFILF